MQVAFRFATSVPLVSQRSSLLRYDEAFVANAAATGSREWSYHVLPTSGRGSTGFKSAATGGSVMRNTRKRANAKPFRRL